MRKKIAKKKGFTLLEILLVLTLLSLLAGLSAPVVTTAILRAKEAALRENLAVMREALDGYFADNGEYPSALSDLVERKYIRFIPVDSVVGDADSWVTNESDTYVGIENVFSGSYSVASDGTYYSEW